MPNKKLREGQSIGMGVKAPVQKPTKDKVKNPMQSTKANHLVVFQNLRSSKPLQSPHPKHL